MSLYNMLHGYNRNAAGILRTLNLFLDQIDRFRDASFGKDGDAYVFHLLCRTGGPNRKSDPNTTLTSHPLYLRDVDDDHDSTYAHYFFRIPETVLAEIAEQGLALDALVDPTSMAQKTESVLQALKESR